MFKVNNKDTSSGVFFVNFEHISHLVLVFLLLTLNMQMPTGKDNGKAFRWLLIDLSKVFDCSSRELLHTFGFSFDELRLVQSDSTIENKVLKWIQFIVLGTKNFFWLLKD